MKNILNDVWSFDGSCIYHCNDQFKLTQKEYYFLRNLTYHQTENDKKLLSKNKYVFNDNPELNRIKAYFKDKIDFYMKEVIEVKNEVALTQSWITINKKGGEHPMHAHRNVFLSLVYYPQVENGTLQFWKGSSSLERHTNLHFDKIRDNVFNSNFFDLKLSNGSVVIFPGWLAHRGLKNTGSVDKIMIGANYFLTGKLGKEINVNELFL